MSNLTISVDEKIVRQARVRAINEGTSVSARIREFLADYAQGKDRQQIAGQAFIAAARRSKANSENAQWSRDDAHDRPYPSSTPSDASSRTSPAPVPGVR